MLIEPKATNAKHAELTPEELATPLAQALQGIITKYVKHEDMNYSEKANFADTLSRAYKAWKEVKLPVEMAEALISANESKATLYKELESILSTGFPSAHANISNLDDVGIITQGPVFATGLCPHHLLPVDYEMYVSYQPKPGGVILGLSKLARTCKTLSTRPILQEDLGADIAAALHHSSPESDADLPSIATMGSAVQIIGSHRCMTLRGACCDALTHTTVLRGSYSKEELKTEFYNAIASIRASKWLPSQSEFTDDFDMDEDEEDHEYREQCDCEDCVMERAEKEAERLSQSVRNPRTMKLRIN